MSRTVPVKLRFALKKSADVQRLTFPRSETPSHTVLQVSSGPPALTIISYLVADGDLAVEDLLIGLLVLKHLGLES